MGDLFFERGFSYKNVPNLWMFERKYQNKAGEMVNQQAYVQESNFAKSLYFRLQTNAYGQGIVEAQNIDQDYAHNSYTYQNDQEFIKWIEYFASLMKSKGFGVLEQISEPTIVERPTKEQQEFLYDNHRNLSEKFAEDYHVAFDCDEEQLLNIVFEIITSLKNEKYQDISDVLLKLAAFYGEWLIGKRTGRWYYESDLGSRVEFPDNGGYPTNTAPLSRMFLCWVRIREFDERQYKELQRGILIK